MRTITVDGCSICQLKCPQCPVSQMGYENTIGTGYLSLENFRKLLEDNPGIKHIEFDNFGELFLNPDLYDILELGYQNRIMMSCAGGVNFNRVSDDILEQLVRTRFQYLNISIDGVSQEVYSKYRVGGNIINVLSNIRKLNGFKEKYKSPYPVLQWQFVVFGHNEHELALAKQFAENYGMRFYPKLNWNSSYSPIRNPEFVKQETGWEYLTREEFEEKTGKSYVRATCYQLWSSPRLSWDLSVTGCCWNVWSRFENGTLEHAKEMLSWKTPCIRDIPCVSCEIYREMKRTGKFLTDSEIRKHVVKSGVATAIKYWKWRSGV